ncbi:MAG: hypothetical protein Q9170_006409 [Blastenia crenularia]
MPRIKAITTGSIPSFLDVILNFAESDKSSSLENQDTWLRQLNAKRNGRLVLYGDDTWLKLFPETFARAEGTSSFFVSDFTEVDQNVTRNVPAELENDDWNGMILHYLGLDHIGHKSGPISPYMVPKQAEMDSVVSEVYHALETKDHLQSTLLVLCGDHGMNDAGNHGGSSEGETSPALVFISPKFQSISEGLECPMTCPSGTLDYYEKVEQSDIAPTLAGLLGLPVPKNNLGIYIPSLLRLRNVGDRLRIAEQNAGQFLDLVNQTFPGVSFDGYPPSSSCSQTMEDGVRLACLWSRVQNPRDENARPDEDAKCLALRTFLKETQTVMSSTSSNYSARKLYAGIALASLAEVMSFGISFRLFKEKHAKWWILLMNLAYGLMMFASSFVEEEHQYWYFFASAWFLRLGWQHYRRSFGAAQTMSAMFRNQSGIDIWSAVLAATPLATTRVIRAWNQTGQKHAGQPDIALGLLTNYRYLLLAQMMSIHGILTLFLMTQSRVTNIPLFALFELQMKVLGSMDLSVCEISLTSLILQYTSFFAFGGSNAISSIDLSNGYNGVSGYNVAVVGILTFCSNWAGPLWWIVASMILLARSRRDGNNCYQYFYHLSTCFAANSVLFVMLACAALRTHLFIWTVFSPKYLYTLAWTLGLHLLLNTSVIGLFMRLDIR